MGATFYSRFYKPDGSLYVGFSSHIYIVPDGSSVNASMPLTEDITRQGMYYRENVPLNNYKIYIDKDKSGSPLEDDLIKLPNGNAYIIPHFDNSIAEYFDSNDNYKLEGTGIKDTAKGIYKYNNMQYPIIGTPNNPVQAYIDFVNQAILDIKIINAKPDKQYMLSYFSKNNPTYGDSLAIDEFDIGNPEVNRVRALSLAANNISNYINGKTGVVTFIINSTLTDNQSFIITINIDAIPIAYTNYPLAYNITDKYRSCYITENNYTIFELPYPLPDKMIGLERNTNMYYPFIKHSGNDATYLSDVMKTYIKDIKVINAQQGKWYMLAYINKSATTGSYLIFNEIDIQTQTVVRLTSTTNSPEIVELNNATGIKTIIAEYAERPNLIFVITLDCTSIANGTYPLAYYSDQNWYYYHISEDRYYYASKNVGIVKYSYNNYKMLAKRLGDVLYIGTKYDDTRDIIICFRKCMANNLMTFNYIQLVNNANSWVVENLERQDGMLILGSFTTTMSDNIGPYSVSYLSIWRTFGGNHTLTYGGLPIQTASTLSFDFYGDGKIIEEGELTGCNEITVKVRNSIYNAENIVDTGIQNHWFYENVFYRIIGASIEVLLEMEMTNPVTFVRYYGMQSLGHSNWMKKQYNAHDIDLTLRTKYNGTTWLNCTSGTYANSPNLEKTIICNDDKSICMSMWIDRAKGLGTKYAIGSTYTPIYTSTDFGKTYHYLIGGSWLFNAGTKHFWHGVYTFFNNKAINGDNFAYISNEEKKQYLNCDLLTASSEEIDVDNNSFDLIVDNKDNTITINNSNNYIMPRGISLTSSGYGNTKIKIGNS